MYAAVNHQEEIFKVLIKNGADPYIKSAEGKTALDYGGWSRESGNTFVRELPQNKQIMQTPYGMMAVSDLTLRYETLDLSKKHGNPKTFLKGAQPINLGVSSSTPNKHTCIIS